MELFSEFRHFGIETYRTECWNLRYTIFYEITMYCMYPSLRYLLRRGGYIHGVNPRRSAFSELHFASS